MNSIVPFKSPGGGGVDSGGDGPQDGDVDSRLKKLENAMQSVTVDLAVIKATQATAVDLKGISTDIAKLQVDLGGQIADLKTSITSNISDLCRQVTTSESTMIKWFIGTAVALVALVVAVLKMSVHSP